MNRQLQLFASRLEAGDEALFFFAGHGVEIAGRNYLLPIDIPDANPGQEDFVKAEAIAVDQVLDTIRARGTRVSILVLDACRDNPFPKAGTRSLGGSRGLARMPAPEGTFIMYSAGVGQTALDRLSDNDPNPNSVFTRSLIPLLKQRGLSLTETARAVRRKVHKLASTISHNQRPAYYDEVTGDFFFAGPAADGKPAGQPPSMDNKAVELAYWDSVKDSKMAEDFRSYLGQFPAGVFSDLAERRIARLEKQKQAKLTSPKEQKLPEPATAGGAPIHVCDRLAAHKSDTNKVVDGVALNKIEAVRAIAACKEAKRQFPDETRFTFQLARAHSAAKDYRESARLYRKAGDLGHTRAMIALGHQYRHGLGMQKDNTEAVRWYRKAAEKGDAKAMGNLGLMYDLGRGVGKDEREAVRWYRKAAEKGDSNAMYGLSYMYARGRGVGRDKKAAAGYMIKALTRRSNVAYWQMRKNANTFSPAFRRELQRLMRQEGVYSGPIDGKFGPGTKRAIEALADK